MFSKVAHGLCGFHMKNNVSNTYKNPHVTTPFVNVSRVYRKDDFMDLMKELMVVKKNLFDKLIEANVCKWSRAYCPIRRYSLMTTNINELINSTLRYAHKTFGVYSYYVPYMVS